ncbi:MAG TPA: hypothetical protein VEP68_05575 [Anaeromyxobacteraceae bacterium]|nr:hypothetical protein [Anaeromyxobacteraceae bacterium]
MGLADSSEAVLAGSPAFLNAVLPPLAAALGVRPRVADAPHQVFALCQDGARLLVCEYRGPEWLPLVEDLKTTFGDELRILVGVPAERASATGPLIGAGADEVLRWDGEPEELVAAAERLAGLAAEIPAPSPQRPAPAVAPSRPSPAVTPARPAPAVAPPPAAAARPAPALTPVKPMPTLTPARPVAAVTPSRPAPAVTPARPVAAVTPARPAAAAAPPPMPEPPLAVDAGAALAAGYFADLDTEDGPRFSIVEAPPDAAARWGDAELVAFEPSGTWPGTVLSSRDAEGLLAGALAGFWPERPDLKGHTERIAAELSPLERDAIAGRPVPADPAPVCRAAALRWQVSAALATAPPPGSPVDAAAVRAILAEIDAALAELKQVSQGAPAEAVPGLDRLRRDLVAEAVDLTEAVHRIAPQEVPPPAQAARAAAAGRTRLLSMQPSEAAEAPGQRRRRVGTWVALGLAVVLGGAYHGWRHFLRPAPPPMPRLAGAPAGFMAPAVPGRVKVLTPEPGKATDPAEVERFRIAEELKGNRVQEVRGVLVVIPAGGAAAPGGPPPQK